MSGASLIDGKRVSGYLGLLALFLMCSLSALAAAGAGVAAR
jgi:hypothetical protein